ncbi:hypothetical protein D3C75_472160 [compost metagenome]
MIDGDTPFHIHIQGSLLTRISRQKLGIGQGIAGGHQSPGIIKHGVAVPAGVHVIGQGQRIGPVLIQRYSVQGYTPDPAAWLKRSVIGIVQPGYLQETPVVLFHLGNTVLQRIPNDLTGHFRLHNLIAIGENAADRLQCHIPLGNAGADASAIGKSHIRLIIIPVCIRNQIADGCLLAARFMGVPILKIMGRHRHLRAQLDLQLCLIAGCQSCDTGIFGYMFIYLQHLIG